MTREYIRKKKWINPNPPKQKIRIICKTCGKIILVHPCFKDRKFCSYKCRRHTDETMKKISIKKQGNKQRFGATLSNNTKYKISCSLKGRAPKSGSFKPKEKHIFWKGGIFKQPYPFEFDKNLKLYIRGIYHFECQLCKSENDLMVHHVDYNKHNIKLNNLIPLCRSCHSKTNYNRERWKDFLNSFIIFPEDCPSCITVIEVKNGVNK